MTARTIAVTLALVLVSTATQAADWTICWSGPDQAQKAAQELARYAGMVLGEEIAVTDQVPPEAGTVFVVTDAEHAPPEISAKLDGLRRDAFIIQYPVPWQGRDVCMLVSHDQFGCDFPVYYFLTQFMGVHWVGPGELGVVLSPMPDWQLPAEINVLENPDFEMRMWGGASFSSREWLARSARMDFHHALGKIFHPDKHANEPEVYPLVDGKRYIPDPTLGPSALAGWQPCTSNPRSIEIATDYVLEMLATHPQLITGSLSVNDGAGNTCECDACRALDAPDAYAAHRRPNLSDRFFHFYNTVTERVVERNPEAAVAVLGYGPAAVPPTQMTIHPRIHVFKVQPSVQSLRDWHAAGANPAIYMWLWDGGFLTVQPDLQMVAELIRECHALGGISFRSEIVPHWVITAPKFYVLAGLLWDISQDPDALLDQYLGLTYGEAAAPHVRAWFDRWYEIYRRRPAENYHENSMGWRHSDQLRYLRRDDLSTLEAALEQAEAAELSEAQAARLGYLRTWHDLMRLNADQWLTAQELGDPKWVLARGPNKVLSAIEAKLHLTPEFDRLWAERVATDTTGWLLDANYHKDPEAYWLRMYGQLRTMVDTAHQSGIDAALETISRRMLDRRRPDEVIAWWEEQMARRPQLERYIGPEANRLRGIEPQNVVLNGNFEDGEAGDLPVLPGWDFYETYGMVHGAYSRYSWQKGTGHDGGRAIGMGEGRYPELKGIISLEKGARYDLSFWYRTEGRQSPANLWIFSYDTELDSPRNIVQEHIHHFARFDLEPTDGEWVRVQRSLTPSVGGTFIIQLAAYYQGPGEYTWFDDVEIRKIW